MGLKSYPFHPPNDAELKPRAQTKCESDNRLQSLSRLGFDGLACVLSLGRSGGIVAAWKKDLIDIVVLRKHRQFLHLECRGGGLQLFFLTAVYALPNGTQKQVLWDELGSLVSLISSPWVLLGDFNDIASADERTGSSRRFEARYGIFSDRLHQCKLSDLGSIGPKC
ncbi:hypothetical protein K1719_029387 [Acacia pycnantha]|nr:hypothetical protein K1719_029387 [Acacia pycnantha]